MEKVYRISRILAYVLVFLAVVNFVGVIYDVELDNVSKTYSYNTDDISKDFAKWKTDFDAFQNACDSNSTITTLQPIVTVLKYIKPLCLYAGMLLFYIMLRLLMAKGSRLNATILLGIVTAIICLIYFIIIDTCFLLLYWNWEWKVNYFTIYIILFVTCIILLIATHASLLRFLPKKKCFATGLILVIVIFLYGTYETFKRTMLIPNTLAISYGAESIFLLSFACFYFTFSKLNN